MLSNVEYSRVGAISSLTAISVGNASAVSHTVSAGKSGVSFQNVGSKVVWYGGANVDPANNVGNKLTPLMTLSYKNVKEDFKIYFKCGGTDTSIIGVIEHE
jgi:hypothetical protein